MGTRSITRVNVTHPKQKALKVLCLYRQMDGYPSGHGRELYNFLKNIKMVNGIPGRSVADGMNPIRLVNGPGCLAAQLVAHFKTETGGFYVEAPEMTSFGQDYEYIIEVYADPGNFNAPYKLNIRVENPDGIPKTLFDGTVEQFEAWTNK